MRFSSPPKRSGWFVFCLLTIVAVCAAVWSSRRDFWFDEILGLIIAEQPFGRPMWEASLAGFDLTPFPPYALVRVTEAFLGRGELTTRLPFLLAGVVACLCFFRFLMACQDFHAAAIGIFMLPLVGAFNTFSEARVYSFVLAGASMAMLGWIRNRNGEPVAGRILLFAGLSIASCSHVWGIAIHGVIVAAELVRSVQRRSVDRAIWAVIAASFLGPLLLYPDLVRVSREIVMEHPIYIKNPLWLYRAVIIKLLLLVAIPVLLTVLLRRARNGPRNPRVSADIATLIGMFWLVPIGVYATARIANTSYMDRYGYPLFLGAAFVGSVLLARVTRGSRLRLAAVSAMLALALAWWTGHKVEKSQFDFRFLAELPREPELIVVGYGLDYLPLEYYAPEPLLRRAAYVADRQRAVDLIGTDGIDSGFVLAKPYRRFRGNVFDYETLLSRYSSFWLVADPRNGGVWIHKQLERDGAVLSRHPDFPDYVFRVDLPDSTAGDE